ncbi:MAG: fumarate hydratase [Eggerthellaceae bacterium]|jgi:fumarate hydratase subunit alpha
MREVPVQDITQTVARLCKEAASTLPSEVTNLIHKAQQTEVSEFGRYALDEVCENLEIAHRDKMPLCQDTGIVLVFLELGQEVHITGGDLEQAVNQGIAQGYTEGYLRKSIVSDPLFRRENTKDNSPGIIYLRMVPGDGLHITVMPKGAGSENMTKLAMLKPAQGIDGVKDFIIHTVASAGGNPCPPTIVGVGIGGNADKAVQLSKEALRRRAGSHHADPAYAQLEEELLHAINKTGIGPQGFGGLNTALAVQIETYPTHIAMLPVAVTLNCYAARHAEAQL